MAREKISGASGEVKWSKYVQVDPYKSVDDWAARGWVFMARSRAEALIGYLDKLNEMELDPDLLADLAEEGEEPSNHYEGLGSRDELDDSGKPKKWMLDTVWHHQWITERGKLGRYAPDNTKQAYTARYFYPFSESHIPWLMKLPKEKGEVYVSELN